MSGVQRVVKERVQTVGEGALEPVGTSFRGVIAGEKHQVGMRLGIFLFEGPKGIGCGHFPLG